MKALLDWLDHRTGYRGLLKEALFEHIPGGARWRYVWGSTLSFALVVQFVTGLVLWTAYSPNAQGAWESVNYIQTQMSGGWILRGIHHYMAQLMTVLLVLHLMQVVIDGAYKAPREVNFWFGLALLFLVLGLSLTGYLLPWDQKGYWATKVATSIASVTPIIGPDVQKLMVGGSEYGHLTLTRFFALHAGVIPGAIIVLLTAHIYLFRRHGITAKKPFKKPDATFWPDQVFCDAVACLAVMATVLFLVFWTHGAELGAPADPSESFDARPDWYFVFLFQLLKYFGGEYEVVGAILLPGALVALVVLMPFFGKWKLGHRFNLGLMGALIAGFLLLTWLGFSEDAHDEEFQRAKAHAEQDAHRVKVLANGPKGIPVGGAVTLLRQDPLSQGPRLFARHCASCHRYDGHDGLNGTPAEAASASDLKGFAGRDWLAGLLDPEHVDSTRYFGATKFAKGKMVRFVKRDVTDFDAPQQDQLAKVIMALSAEARLPYQQDIDAADAAAIEEGRVFMDNEDLRCTECHDFRGLNDEPDAPLLTGYGSRDWLIRIISNPEHETLYGDRNDRMPLFGENQVLTAEDIGLVADWLRRDWYEPSSVIGDR